MSNEQYIDKAWISGHMEMRHPPQTYMDIMCRSDFKRVIADAMKKQREVCIEEAIAFILYDLGIKWSPEEREAFRESLLNAEVKP